MKNAGRKKLKSIFLSETTALKRDARNMLNRKRTHDLKLMSSLRAETTSIVIHCIVGYRKALKTVLHFHAVRTWPSAGGCCRLC